MNDETSLPPLAVTISREELLAILNVLRSPTIPGLDSEPSGELTPEQEAFAIVVARRALLARGLAQLRADGEFLVQRGLLAAVGACAYAQDSILVLHLARRRPSPAASLRQHPRGRRGSAHAAGRGAALLHPAAVQG